MVKSFHRMPTRRVGGRTEGGRYVRQNLVDPEDTSSAFIEARAPANPERFAVEIDLRESAETQETSPGPWLSRNANLLNATPSIMALRRLVDISGAVVAFIILLPVALATAVAIKTTSGGPVLFKQRRVGQHGCEFDFYKFRSMKVGAVHDKAELLHLNEGSGPTFKMRDDPRITRVGRSIRRTSIDELPQLWHVLRGQMSLVGPRPQLPAEVAEYGSWERQRLVAKPGITCIWQVSGRSELDFATWVAMDIEYVETWSLWLDLMLLLRTVPAVLSGRGAY